MEVAQKLEALLKLQTIDSQLDEIKKVRGDLPEEVRDLEDELIGFETRISKFEKELASFEEEITNRKIAIKDAEKLIKKYEDQQTNVRNNREYDAISKEMELQQLEIQISEKKIKEAQFKIEQKKKDIKVLEGTLEERSKDLANKKSELDIIIAESQEEEAKFDKDRNASASKIEERLFHSYERLRNNAINGLAVVLVKRGACGGCFNTVPPQRQADIKEKKKLIVCEHCGRILAGVDNGVLETA
ncbi:MAG: hypothetical protein RL060_1892 [Bacteroidota bacterium]|jgi:predicted  nucleic acid-binding Zn-ribbon protein